MASWPGVWRGRRASEPVARTRMSYGIVSPVEIVMVFESGSIAVAWEFIW